jgi:hypothetical protein
VDSRIHLESIMPKGRHEDMKIIFILSTPPFVKGNTGGFSMDAP